MIRLSVVLSGLDGGDLRPSTHGSAVTNLLDRLKFNYSKIRNRRNNK